MSRVAYQCVACFFLSCVIGGLVPTRHGLFAAEDTRLPVPPQEKVEEAIALIRDAYEADYRAAKESGEPEQLIAQLNALAGGEADPVRKYALFVEAENVASAHDNFKKAVELLDARADLFRIDGLALRSDLLKRLAGPKVSADLELCDQAMDTAQRAMQSERFGLASEAAALAVSIAKAVDREQKTALRKQRKKDGGNFVAPPPIGVELVKKSTALQAQVTATEKLFEQYGDAVQKAKSSPDSPSANAVIGSYLCFVRQDWKAGLPALAKSDVKEFSALAANDLELAAAPSPKDAQKAFELAGKWWTAAESKGVSADHESAIKDHAATLYADIADRLPDTLQKRVAASRLRGIVKPGRAEAALSDSQAGLRDGGSATETPQREERSKWVEDNGNRTFQRDADSMLWREYGRDGRSSFVFKQTAETPDYVEIVDEGRNMVCRIRKDVFEWTTRDKPDAWNFMANGRWETNEPAIQKTPKKDSQSSDWREMKFDVEPGGVVITGYTGMDPVVVIPPVIQGRPVIAIKEGAFAENTTVTRVVLPRGLIRIGGGAFRNCRQLSEVVIPEGVRDIGNDAFAGCRLRERLPALAADGSEHFLTYCIRPEGIEVNGYSGAGGTLRIPDKIAGRPVIVIGNDAFNGRAAIRSVILPASVEAIGNAAFAGCSGMESIEMPASLVGIGFDAFHQCKLLKSITLPSRVSQIVGGGWCFLGCSSLEEINVDKANTTFTSVKGVLYNKEVTTLIACPGGKGGVCEIPPTVTSIAGEAFTRCAKLEQIVIPQSVVDIHENAFRDCTAKQLKKQ